METLMWTRFTFMNCAIAEISRLGITIICFQEKIQMLPWKSKVLEFQAAVPNPVSLKLQKNIRIN